MNKIQNFHKSFNEALTRIEGFRNDPDMSVITEFLLTTEINPYGLLGDAWGGSMSSAETFNGLLCYIHHALYDDGDICFPVVNGRPRIVFANRHDDIRNVILSEQEKRLEADYGSEYKITFLDTVEEFVKAATEFHISEIRRCFFMDAETHGVEFAVSVYSKYSAFSNSWAEDFQSLAYIDSAEKFSKSFSRVAMRKGVDYAVDLYEASEWYNQEAVDAIIGSLM